MASDRDYFTAKFISVGVLFYFYSPILDTFWSTLLYSKIVLTNKMYYSKFLPTELFCQKSNALNSVVFSNSQIKYIPNFDLLWLIKFLQNFDLQITQISTTQKWNTGICQKICTNQKCIRETNRYLPLQAAHAAMLLTR